MLAFRLSLTAGGGRVAGLRRVPGERTGLAGLATGVGSGCCPPDDESEEVLWVGWDLHEV